MLNGDWLFPVNPNLLRPLLNHQPLQPFQVKPNLLGVGRLFQFVEAMYLVNGPRAESSPVVLIPDSAKCVIYSQSFLGEIGSIGKLNALDHC